MFTAMDKPATVYMAVNKINGKRYIGVTGRTVELRAFEHVRDALKGIGRGAFAHAIRKYGADGFDWLVVSDHDAGREAVAEEKRLIRTVKPEYNSTIGGEGYHPRVLSEDARRRISEANRGNTYCLGKTHTSETKEKLRAAGLRDKDKWLARSHLGPASMAKAVICLDDGQVYPSASEAARAYDADKSAVIEVCCRKPYRRTAAGRVFRYVDDYNGDPDEVLRAKRQGRAVSAHGFRGIERYAIKTGVRWRARLSVGPRGAHRLINLGSYDTAEEAQAVYLRAKEEARDGLE